MVMVLLASTGNAQQVAPDEIYDFDEQIMFSPLSPIRIRRFLEEHNIDDPHLDAAPPDWLISQLDTVTQSGDIVIGALPFRSWTINYIDDGVWPAAGLPYEWRVAFADEETIAFIGHNVPPYAVAVESNLSVQQYIALGHDSRLIEGLPLYWWNIDRGMPEPIGRGSNLCVAPERDIAAFIGPSYRPYDHLFIYEAPSYETPVPYLEMFSQRFCMPSPISPQPSPIPGREGNPRGKFFPNWDLVVVHQDDLHAGETYVQLRRHSTDEVVIDDVSSIWRYARPPNVTYAPIADAFISWEQERARVLQRLAGVELERAIRDDCIDISRIDLGSQPRETIACAPPIPGAFWFYPLADGMLIASRHSALEDWRANSFAGIYFVPEESEEPPTRVLTGYIDGLPAVSPSGCRIAFSIAPFQDATTSRFTDTARLAVIDLCQGMRK